MTKDKLKKEAEDIVYGMGYDTYESDGHSDYAVQDILIEFAEPKEKRIEELKQQIKKMECCGNCVHFDFNEPNYCHKGVYRANQNVCDEWCFGN